LVGRKRLKKEVYSKGDAMKTLRDGTARNTVAITLLLLALAAVLVSRLAPAAAPAPPPGAALADDSFFDIRYELKNVIVTSILPGDLDGNGPPDETLELDFNGARLTYIQFDATGRPAGQTSAEW
jgi:hypothetical protein